MRNAGKSRSVIVVTPNGSYSLAELSSLAYRRMRGKIHDSNKQYKRHPKHKKSYETNDH